MWQYILLVLQAFLEEQEECAGSEPQNIPENIGPLTELEYWKTRYNKFENIQVRVPSCLWFGSIAGLSTTVNASVEDGLADSIESSYSVLFVEGSFRNFWNFTVVLARRRGLRRMQPVLFFPAAALTCRQRQTVSPRAAPHSSTNAQVRARLHTLRETGRSLSPVLQRSLSNDDTAHICAATPSRRTGVYRVVEHSQGLMVRPPRIPDLTGGAYAHVQAFGGGAFAAILPDSPAVVVRGNQRSMRWCGTGEWGCATHETVGTEGKHCPSKARAA